MLDHLPVILSHLIDLSDAPFPEHKAGIAIEVAERRRQTVAAVFLRHPAERPQGILKPGSECDKALAPEHDVGVLETGVGEPEMVEPMLEANAGHRDLEIA